MNRFARRLATILICLLVLAACTHSRIVRRDNPDQPDRHGRADHRMASAARASPARLPRGSMHVVKSGETLYGISFRYGLRYQDVAAWNGISDPYVIEIGQELRLRPGNEIARAPRRTPDRATSQTVTAPSRPERVPATRPGPASAPAPVGSSTAAALTVGAPSWRWPAQGAVIGRYVAGDQTRQGIDIAGTAGQSVSAAAEGVVVYSGAGLVGYGELIIIKHSEEWLSAYAHNRRRLVSEGVRVKAGDVIAEMGRSGAPRDMLHFEIRRNGKPVDPFGYLPRQ